jgi:hypothetical protein
MIENIVRKYLKTVLRTPAFLEEPVSPPAGYILVGKTGSSDSAYLSRATVTVQTYGASLLEAAALCGRVKAAMKEITSLEEVTRCECGGDYNFTDPDTHRYRYQAVFYITYYEEGVTIS